MATEPLPARPNLEQLRKQARELQRQQGAHDTSSLSGAQRAVARRYGFSSWPRLKRHVEAIASRTWILVDATDDEPAADRLVRLACLNYVTDSPTQRRQAVELWEQQPELATASLAAAVVCGNVAEVRRRLSAEPAVVGADTGPYAWPPLMYAAYGRLEAGLDSALEMVRLLLSEGANPNDGRFFSGLPTPFSVLTGVFGGGENDQPPHPYAIALARLLLRSGADPNDGQTLYNRMFRAEDDFLEVLLAFGLGQGDGGPWRRLLPDLLPAPPVLLRDLLGWAVTHDQRERVGLLARHGVDVVSPLPSGDTPIETALRNGHSELAEELRALGAQEPHLPPVDAFVAAALAADAAAVRAAPEKVVEAARAARPGLIAWAAGQGRVDAVELLVSAGFDVNAMGRGDVPVEQPWQTGLHTAVERGDAAMVRALLALGADPSRRDKRFDATASDWTHHLERPDMAVLFDE
jgi:ankyrin repeat protein